MKKKILIVLLVVLILSLAMILVGCSDTPKDSELFNYILIDDEQHYEILGKEGVVLPSNLVIPSEYKGKPVTSIGYRAFDDCTTITSVEIPSSIIQIDEFAFSGKWNKEMQSYESLLSSVVFEKGSKLEIIGEHAFWGCSSLESIEIPRSVKIIEGFAFDSCNKLESVSFEEDSKLETIDGFTDCISLKNIEIPKSVTYIDALAFSNCSSLESLLIPSSVEKLGQDAFSECYNLTLYFESNKIPPKATYGSWKPDERPMFTSVKEGDYITENGIQYVFLDDGTACVVGHSVDISNVVIKDKVTIKGIEYDVKSINSYVFKDCSALTDIYIPSSINRIGSYVFENCENLNEIIIPKNVEIMGRGVFDYCDDLTIYCEAERKPSGWNSFWNYFGQPVVWGYQG